MGNANSVQEIRTQLEQTVFGKLGEEALNQICASARIERYQMPTVVNAAGATLQHLRLVTEGYIAIVSRRASGKEVAISHVSPGSWATWLPCLLGSAPDNDLVTGAAATCIALPAGDVRMFCEQYPKVFPFIIGEIGERQRLLMEWAGQSVLIGPTQRMAKLIHLLARDQKFPGNSGMFHVTQVRLAGLARCSRQTANALLSDLEKRGLISQAYGKFEILDLAKLAAFANEEMPD